MGLTTVREKLKGILDDLTDEQIVKLWQLADIVRIETEHQARYNPLADPYRSGTELFAGSADLSERIEEILYGTIPPTSDDLA